MSKLLSKAFDPVYNWVARRYQAVLARELKKYGLRYDDLYDDLYDLDVKEALRRLPEDEVDLRNQRLKRALDCSLKHVYLPKELQDKQTPFKPYLQDMLKLVKQERKEREALGSEVPYQRTIP
ncbi:hypothetical protein O6H91_07G062500 [Diphasiastrum complanatum]|uniref:Uncharacterized protein n=1 Tax=Diphasiastrum complanatum TaxID=34168 RepID=A0ACC2D608_DIPCM|nr:hypothetical protein O6H91_07G062500 [Diphasiastrum complanatum]